MRYSRQIRYFTRQACGFFRQPVPSSDVWDPQWYGFCEALAGSFTFDFRIYRDLDCASRRLFLLLSKIIWRNDVSPRLKSGSWQRVN